MSSTNGNQGSAGEKKDGAKSGGFGESGEAGGYGPDSSRANTSFGDRGANPTNVYIAQFPSHWTKHEIYEICHNFGPISEIRVLTKPTEARPNRGIAFVHYQMAESAAAAVAHLNYTTPGGASHKLLVKLANKSKNIPMRGPSSDMRLTFYGPDSFEFVSRTLLLVAGYPVAWQTDSLQQVFSQFGRVLQITPLAQPPLDVLTGLPPTSASAFLMYESPESTVQAVAVLDGSPATADHSHVLNVKFAPVPQDKYPYEITRDQLVQMESSTNVYVTRFPNAWGQAELGFVFAPYGGFTEVRVLTKQNPPGENRGVGFVHYKDPLSATLAVAKLHESQPAGCYEPICVQFAKVHGTLHQQITGRGRPGIVAAAAKAAAHSAERSRARGGAAGIVAKTAAAGGGAGGAPIGPQARPQVMAAAAAAGGVPSATAGYPVPPQAAAAAMAPAANYGRAPAVLAQQAQLAYGGAATSQYSTPAGQYGTAAPVAAGQAQPAASYGGYPAQQPAAAMPQRPSATSGYAVRPGRNQFTNGAAARPFSGPKAAHAAPYQQQPPMNPAPQQPPMNPTAQQPPMNPATQQPWGQPQRHGGAPPMNQPGQPPFKGPPTGGRGGFQQPAAFRGGRGGAGAAAAGGPPGLGGRGQQPPAAAFNAAGPAGPGGPGGQPPAFRGGRGGGAPPFANRGGRGGGRGRFGPPMRGASRFRPY